MGKGEIRAHRLGAITFTGAIGHLKLAILPFSKGWLLFCRLLMHIYGRRFRERAVAGLQCLAEAGQDHVHEKTEGCDAIPPKQADVDRACI